MIECWKNASLRRLLTYSSKESSPVKVVKKQFLVAPKFKALLCHGHTSSSVKPNITLKNQFLDNAYL